MQTRTVLDIPIYHKAYELCKILYSCHPAIPKTQLYTIWQKCEEVSIDMLEAIIHTGHTHANARIEAIYKISEKLDLLKTFMRLTREANSISQKKHLEIQSLLQEIGKMVGGWIKSVPHPK